MNEKPKLLLFTTKSFGNNFLFNDTNEKINLDSKSSIFEHLLNRSNVIENWDTLLKDKKKEEIFNLLFKEVKSIKEKCAKLAFCRGKVGTNCNNKVMQFYEAGKIYEEYKKEKKLSNDSLYTLGIKLYKKAYKPQLNFEEVYGENANFKWRKYIYKLKDKEIYAYRCLDLGFTDEVYIKTQNPQKNFIFSILSDIAKDKGVTVDKLYEDNHIYLILHADDIGFNGNGVTLLNCEQINDYLVKNNMKLKSYYNGCDKEEKVFYHKVITFHHDYGFIPDILAKKFKEDEIVDEITNFFKYRKEYKEIENNIFKNGWSKNERKKFIELKKKVKRKLY